jgi:hypothetical protein
LIFWCKCGCAYNDILSLEEHERLGCCIATGTEATFTTYSVRIEKPQKKGHWYNAIPYFFGKGWEIPK